MYVYNMKGRVSILAVRKANDKMSGKVSVQKSFGSGIAVTVKTGKLSKTYTISSDKITQAYKIAKSK